MGAPPSAKSPMIYSLPIPNILGKTISTFILEFAPGEVTPPHRHGSSFVVAFVLEGELRSQVDDEPLRTYKAGEMWTELPGAHHLHGSNPSTDKRAKLLAVLIHNSNDTEIFKLD